jgi:hypothetical protein
MRPTKGTRPENGLATFGVVIVLALLIILLLAASWFYRPTFEWDW